MSYIHVLKNKTPIKSFYKQSLRGDCGGFYISSNMVHKEQHVVPAVVGFVIGFVGRLDGPKLYGKKAIMTIPGYCVKGYKSTLAHKTWRKYSSRYGCAPALSAHSMEDCAYYIYSFSHNYEERFKRIDLDKFFEEGYSVKVGSNYLANRCEKEYKRPSDVGKLGW